MIIFRSPARELAGSKRDRESQLLTLGGCQCASRHDRVSDLSRRVSSHRTSQGHVVYYRCDCGVIHMALVRWTTEPSTGVSRLR